MHLSILGALWLGVQSWGYLLHRYELMYEVTSLVSGPGYTAVNVTMTMKDSQNHECGTVTQTLTVDQDDPDDDQVGASCDNCPDDANPTQADFNRDGVGDACANCPAGR